jgi:hypothetical protein
MRLLNWEISCETCDRVSPWSCCACGSAVRSASDWRALVRCSRATSAFTWPCADALPLAVVSEPEVVD